MATTSTLVISDETVRVRLDGLQKHVHLSWGDTSIKLSLEEAVDVIDGITSAFERIEELRQEVQGGNRQTISSKQVQDSNTNVGWWMGCQPASSSSHVLEEEADGLRHCSATDPIDDPDCPVHSAADHRVARAQYLYTLFKGSD